MADVQITRSDIQCQAQTQVTKPVVWISNLVGYLFVQRNDDYLRGSGWYIKTIDGGATWSQSMGGGPAFTVIFAGSYIYVATLSAPGQILKVDPASMKVIDVWTGTGSYNCRGLAFDGAYIYAGFTTDPSKVYKIDPATMTTVLTWTGAVGQKLVYALAFDGTYIYAGLGTTAAQVVQIDPATMTTVNTWTGAADQINCYSLDYKSPYIYAGLLMSSNPAQVVKIDPATMTTVNTWTGAAGQYDYSLTFDGTYLYAGMSKSPADVVKINPVTMLTVSTWTGAAGQNACRGLALNGTYIYAGLQVDFPYLVQINLATMTTVNTVKTTRIHVEAPVENSFLGFSCWFDQWTPGNTGTKIHVVWHDYSSNSLKYRALDTSTDTFGAQIVVASGLSAYTSYRSSITKSIGGNLYIVHRRNGGGYFYRSLNNGADWEARTAPLATNPACQPSLTPGNEADNQDIYGVWYAGSNLNLYWYDDSANTWTTTLIYTDTSSPILVSSIIRKSDNHTLVTAKKTNGANYGLGFWDVSNGTTFTAKTNIYTNEANHGIAGFSILATDGKLHVSFGGIAGVSANAAAYKTSTDGGTTWSAATRLDEGNNVSVVVDSSLNQVTAGGRLYGTWAVGTAIWGNYGTSLPLKAGGMKGLNPGLMAEVMGA